jgi:hypothetical protein
MRKPECPHEVLEQELESLISAGQDHEDQVRKRVRVIKNRLSAKKSREQARDYVSQLEQSLSALMAHNQSLARRLALVEYDNVSLRQHLYFGSQPNTPPHQNPIDQPAVLSKSLQMDPVLVLCMFVAWLIGHPPAPIRNPGSSEASWEPSPWRAAPAEPCPGPWARRSRRFLRRAALLGRFDHLCPSIQRRPRLRPATSAAAWRRLSA